MEHEVRVSKRVEAKTMFKSLPLNLSKYYFMIICLGLFLVLFINAVFPFPWYIPVIIGGAVAFVGSFYVNKHYKKYGLYGFTKAKRSKSRSDEIKINMTVRQALINKKRNR